MNDWFEGTEDADGNELVTVRADLILEAAELLEAIDATPVRVGTKWHCARTIKKLREVLPSNATSNQRSEAESVCED